MNITDIKTLLDGGESITVELLGVKDSGDVVGVDPSCVEKIKKNFVTSINNLDKISPTFYTNIE